MASSTRTRTGTYIWLGRTWSCASGSRRRRIPVRGRRPSLRGCPIRRRRSNPICPCGKSPRSLCGTTTTTTESEVITTGSSERRPIYTFVVEEAVDETEHALQSAVLFQIMLNQSSLVVAVSSRAAASVGPSPNLLLLLLLALAMDDDGHENGQDNQPLAPPTPVTGNVGHFAALLESAGHFFFFFFNFLDGPSSRVLTERGTKNGTRRCSIRE